MASSADIWVEKYRPQTLDDVEGHTETLDRLRCIAKDGNIPHLLLAGPPGTGKTSSVLSLARQLLDNDTELFRKGVMELNASDDRGIDVVRDQIKSFAMQLVGLPKGKFKIIILDEVDSMTPAAQQALRRLMEVNSDTTRFALACNQSTKVIEPIQSRCAILRFSKLKDEQILRRILMVTKTEGVTYTDDGLDTLVFTADGDMRNAINNLQSTVNGFGIVNRENVLKVCDVPPPERVRDVFTGCQKKNFKMAHQALERLLDEGYSCQDILGVMRSVVRRMNLQENAIVEYLKEMARTNYRAADGCSTKLQMDKLLCNLCRISSVSQGGSL